MCRRRHRSPTRTTLMKISQTKNSKLKRKKKKRKRLRNQNPRRKKSYHPRQDSQG